MADQLPINPDRPDGAAPSDATPAGFSSKIRHTKPGIGSHETPGITRSSIAGSPASSSLPSIDASSASASDQGSAAVPVVEADDFEMMRPKIVALGSDRKHEEEWRRTPNTTGQGAIHVRTFHAKLTDDALVYMDRAINEWLDAHPQYEVKFVNASIGILTGKIKEPHLICQVWV